MNYPEEMCAPMRADLTSVGFVELKTSEAVSELLDILKITKQSLSRVLSVLIIEEFVIQRKNEADLRRRHLFLTEKGTDLEHQLTQCQSQWIDSAYREAGPIAVKGFEAVLRGIINREDQKRIKPSCKASLGKE